MATTQSSEQAGQQAVDAGSGAAQASAAAPANSARTARQEGNLGGDNKKTGQKSAAKRGFAAMDEVLQREIASKGGQAAHQKGTAHEFDSEEARKAGQKGGVAVSRNREHMAQIGRKGGESRQSVQRENEGRSQASTGASATQQGGKASRQSQK